MGREVEQVAMDFDLEQLLDRASDVGADLDPRGSTCWWVLVDGEQVGWVRRTLRDVYRATVMWTGVKRRPNSVEVFCKEFDLDGFDAAVAWVVEHRGQATLHHHHRRRASSAASDAR